MGSLMWLVTIWARASEVSVASERRSAAARPTAAAKAMYRAAVRNAAAWSAALAPVVTASTISFIRQTAKSGTTPWRTALNMALAVLQGVVPLFAVCLMKLIVDAVTTGASAADHAAAFRTAALYIALAAAVGLAAALRAHSPR